MEISFSFVHVTLQFFKEIYSLIDRLFCFRYIHLILYYYPVEITIIYSSIMDFENNTGESFHNSYDSNIQLKQTKKKSRGNRKLQRYRRNLRNQDMNSDSSGKLMISFVDATASRNEETTTTITDQTIVHVSQIIKGKNKQNKKNNQIRSNKSVSSREVKTPPLIKDTFNYSSILDEIFSQMLSVAFSGAEKLSCLLNVDEKLKFIRDYTSLIDRQSYVQLQEFQWKYYYDIGMTQNIWTGHLAKHLAEKYSICHIYGRSKTLIEQRLKQIERQLQQVHNAIQHFEDEMLSKCAFDEDCANAMRKLSSILHLFVQEKQRSLQYEFEYKRKMFILDATDHQLLQKFFDAQPNKSHVRRYSIIFQWF